MSFLLPSIRIDHLSPVLHLPIDVLRLDLLHPVVSGNKWFKLKHYLKKAKEEEKSTVLTYGGAYSNHIVATAAAARQNALKSIGVIRGEEPKHYSHTLQEAQAYKMQLYFVSREAYKQKSLPPDVLIPYTESEVLQIPEGGYGALGMMGAKDILGLADTTAYTHIISAVGTGTTLAGLIEGAKDSQKIVGIPVLKNAFSLPEEINALLTKGKLISYEMNWNYHFGGYAKHSSELIRFMNDFFLKTAIPTDFVYTAKTFYAAIDFFTKGFLNTDDKILLIHTGGLQGNKSLPKGTLIFGH